MWDERTVVGPAVEALAGPMSLSQTRNLMRVKMELSVKPNSGACSGKPSCMKSGRDRAKFDGGGLEQGNPCFDGYHRARKFLIKQCRRHLVQHLDRVAIGGSTNADRFDRNKKCRTCGASCEMSTHRFHQCPGLNKLDGEDPFVDTWIEKTSG